jgi:S-adenosylmethionine:tRNA ribosyltransferase-isomerase
MIKIDLKEYNYNLPVEKIAQYPLKDRDGSRLLLYKSNKTISEDRFRNIDNHIPPGSLLVFNNTKVIRARLIFYKESGARIEILCLEPLTPSDYSNSFASRDPVEWNCIIGNNRKWKENIVSTFFVKNNIEFKLTAEKLNQVGDSWRIRFSWNAGELNFGEVIENTGHVPLPPYISRPDEPEDSERYQTIYSTVKGSVAAPTAGLHFTREVLKNLIKKEIQTTHITLHVGAGTFQPVKSENILEHQMHSEHFFITSGALELVLKNLGSVLAVGTTAVRTLESLFWLGMKLIQDPCISPDNLYLDQWEAYSFKNDLDQFQSLETILLWMQRNDLKYIHGSTRIIIVPGYEFKITNGIVTNFHQPKSTLLLLISAWTGNDWKRIYKYALENDFRFLSYGDSSLLL